VCESGENRGKQKAVLRCAWAIYETPACHSYSPLRLLGAKRVPSSESAVLAVSRFTFRPCQTRSEDLFSHMSGETDGARADHDHGLISGHGSVKNVVQITYASMVTDRSRTSRRSRQCHVSCVHFTDAKRCWLRVCLGHKQMTDVLLIKVTSYRRR
jgi:hypothetical protein